MTPRYLILSAGDRAGAAALRAAGVRLAAETDWRRAATCGAAEAWTPGGEACWLSTPGPGLLVIGRLVGAPSAAGADTPVARRATELLRGAWGAYVAVLQDPSGTEHLLRDPSGEVDAVTWRTREGVLVAAPDLFVAPPWLQPARLSLNWDRIATFTNMPSAGTAHSLLDDVETVAPGALARLGDGRSQVLIWSPAAIAADPIKTSRDVEADLVGRVDAAVAALARPHRRLVMELSGGLDSAILATSLAATGAARKVAEWYNGAGARPDADESYYARQVTDHIGCDLTVVAKPVTALTVEHFTEMAQGFRPATNAVDAVRDREMAARTAKAGATGVVSGQGGDAAFYQMPSSYLITDILRARGPGVLAAPELAALARRRRASAWRILREALEARRDQVLPIPRNRLLTAAAAAHATASRHPWEADCAGAPLSRQLHVRALAKAHASRGDCRRGRAADLIYPLMTQPVVELCLAISPVELGAGMRDRPLARRAFAARLPEAIVARRSKGNLTPYFAQLLASSADALRPFLADGVLARAGVIDRAVVERWLDPQQLLHAPRPSEILMAAATEAWVRHWQTRAPDSPSAPWR